jgi:hypothetical protein
MFKKYGQYVVGGVLAALGGLQATGGAHIVPAGYEDVFMAACGLAVVVLHKVTGPAASATGGAQ